MNPLLMLGLGMLLGKQLASKPDDSKSSDDWKSTSSATIGFGSLGQAFVTLGLTYPLLISRNYMRMFDDGAQQADWIFIPLGACMILTFVVTALEMRREIQGEGTPEKAVWWSAGLALIAAAAVWLWGPATTYMTCTDSVVHWKYVRECTPPGLSPWVFLLLDLTPASLFALAIPLLRKLLKRS